MRQLEAWIRRFDGWQQRYRPTSFVTAIAKKYADDRAQNMAALLAYHAFVAVTPLLLVFFTVLGYVLPSDAGLRRDLTNSALSDFPVIGRSLQSPSLHGHLLGVFLGVLVSLWGATGVARTFQFAMSEIWNVPGKDRPEFILRQLRGLWLLVLLAGGVAGTATLNATGNLLNLGSWGNVLVVPAAVVNIALIYLSYRVFTPGSFTPREMLPGAIIAGVAYELLQTLGVALVTHEASRAGEFYQTFGVVVGFMAFVYLGAQMIVISAEFNVVRVRHLWPRTLYSPPFTAADKIELIEIAKREARVEGQTITVEF